MSETTPETLQMLSRCGQQHLLQILDELPAAEADQLLQILLDADLEMLVQAWRNADAEPVTAPKSNRAETAAAPANVVWQPQSEQDHQRWIQATAAGEEELSAGNVAVITVAGGQGTRLGFDQPKGMFPIGPHSGRTLFQIFAEQILARRQRYAAPIPWLIMTSSATHSATVEFFQQQGFFGLDQRTVHFFQQGSLPALDARTGQVLFARPGVPALSPDGHGGLLRALKRSGLQQQMSEQGIRHLYYHQVDNPTAIVADPALIGFHNTHKSQLTTLVVSKTSPEERMGALVEIDGRTEIIEYSELTPQQAARKDSTGQWIFWAGNTAVHVFCPEFLQQLTNGDRNLPLHVARKMVPCVDLQGQPVPVADSAVPNAVKLERFIFDALPAAKRTLIVEGCRERQFNPVKNATGSDSADTCREALNRIAGEWLRRAGLQLRTEAAVEVSPLQALDAEQLSMRVAAGELQLSDFLMD